MSSYKLLEIYRLIQAYNIPWNLNFQTVYENPEKTLPRTRPGNNRTQFLHNSAYPNEVGQFASPWPFTVWCGSNCIPSPCLWLYLLEQHLNLKIWTTLNFESTSWLVCSQISWPSYLMSCSTPILLKISSTSLSLRSSIRNAISSCKSTESRSPSSQISTFSALVSPFFLLIADSLEKNDWTCPFVSHSSLERSWTTCVSGRSHVRCDLRKIWFPTLCHFSPAQVCFPLWSGYRHSVRPVGLPQSFPRFARCIGHTNIFSPCWAVLPKYPARCKVSSLSVIFSFVKWHRLEWAVITLTCYID